jgi:hypothetical protein
LADFSGFLTPVFELKNEENVFKKKTKSKPFGKEK